MFYYKSNTDNGLDYFVNNYIIDNKPVLKNVFYFFVYDYVKTKKLLPIDVYSIDNNSKNTWNYNLNYFSTSKDTIMKDSIRFGFGSYYYDTDDSIIVKAKGHCHTTNLYGQAHKVNKKEFEQIYDKNLYIGQKILKSSETNINEELNIFIVRELNTRKLYFYCILCINDLSININRKFSKCMYKEVTIDILEEKKKNFINYLDFINFDYGRIELINDINLGWCIIDVNNSPGRGPITDLACENVGKLFLHVLIS